MRQVKRFISRPEICAKPLRSLVFLLARRHAPAPWRARAPRALARTLRLHVGIQKSGPGGV